MTKKRTIAVIDCETDPFKRGRIPAPFIWGFYNGETYEEFTNFNEVPSTKLLKDMRDTSELIPYLQSQDIIVYAHNGGKFDYHFLPGERLVSQQQRLAVCGHVFPQGTG